MRVPGRTRISRSTEESASLERQRGLIEQWCRDNGHTLIGIAENVDVSGSVDPFQTPALRPWLTERVDDWDILLVWHMDRLPRQVCQRHR